MNRCPSCLHPEKFHHLCGVPQPCDYEADGKFESMCGCEYYLTRSEAMTREEAEQIFGPIAVEPVFPPVPIRTFDYCAYFDRYLDNETPYWMRAFGETREEALNTLLEQAAEHHGEGGDNGESREWLNGMDLLGRNL